MTEQTIPAYDDEISLLDILVTLAESWKLLVFGPLITGVLASGLSFLWPKTFESVAIVRLAEDELVLLHTAPVLDELIEKFGLFLDGDRITDEDRQNLKKRLTYSSDKKTKLATVVVKASTPEVAQALNRRAIQLTLNELQIKGGDKLFIEKTIAINNRAIASAEDAIESIQRSLKKNGLGDQAQESAIKNLSIINADVAKLSQDNEVLRQKMEPKGVEVFVQMPSMPTHHVSPSLKQTFTLTVFAAVFIIILFIFCRVAWNRALLDKEAAEKIALIKRSFR